MAHVEYCGCEHDLGYRGANDEKIESYELTCSRKDYKGHKQAFQRS
ncbi:hypothetical protein SDC9_212288 [bioreactor metagenome]|uniref:Uncharacterized protein n=1 Tax=bioreactor metagenome TaxID=1076179 RepID=A0A645JZY1_9ZZZZ